MKTLYLSDGSEAQVSDCDYILCLGYSWWPHPKGYAQSRVKGKMILLHTFIAVQMRLTGQLDHEDRNKRNCQRENLRPSTTSQNQMNQAVDFTSSLGIKGVAPTVNGTFEAYIKVNYRKIHLGRFPTKELAADARRLAEVKHFGEFASVPEDSQHTR